MKEVKSMKAAILILMVGLVSGCQAEPTPAVQAASPALTSVPADPVALPNPVATATPVPSPTVTPSPTPSPSPTVSPVTVVNLAWNDYYEFCRDLEAWHPEESTIVFPTGYAATTQWVFSQSGVRVTNLDGSNPTISNIITINIPNPGNCVVHLSAGQFVSVN
jgi:hypothetical protein